jgi:hypothetical protein
MQVQEGRREFFENLDQVATTFEDLMGALFGIEGYKASAILTGDGEVLYDTTPPKTSGNFGAWMKVFNNLFNHTCNLSESSGFLACQQVSMRTGDEVVIIRSSGQDCQDGLRLLVIIDHQGNTALIHQQLDQLLPPLMRHLSRDPDNLGSLYLKNPGSNCRRGNANMSNMNCDCGEPTDPLHCNKCDHVFCGSCQVVFKSIKDSDIRNSPKKSCPNCFSTDLYRKMNFKQQSI